MPVLSGLSYQVTDTTIVATWTTDVPADSNLSAGGKAALDNGYAANSTAHQAIVTGLQPSTTYSCFVTSGGVATAPHNVITASSPRRIALVSGGGSGAITQVSANDGDTFKTFVSNDGKTYITEDDGHGFGASPNASYATQLWQLSDDNLFTGAGSTLLTNYQPQGSTQGTDGPGGAAMTNKSTGLFGLNGNLHMFVYRQFPPTYSSSRYCNVIKSPDHGATWNNFTAPATFVAGGVVLSPQSPAEPVQLWDLGVGLVSPIRYAADDGTLGYNTAGNQIDGANAYVYCSFQDDTDGYAGNFFLFRIPRIRFDAQDFSTLQFWNGPASPSAADFVKDANWSSTASSKTAMLVVATPGWIAIDFLPSLNSYLLSTYTSASLTDTTFRFFTGPTPAGPWTQIATQENTPAGYYGAFPMHRDLINLSNTKQIALRMIFSGDYNVSAVYKPTVQTWTFSTALNPMIFVQATNNGLAGGGTTVAYGSNVTKGNLLICSWRKTLPETVTAVNDTLGNSWTIVYDTGDGSGTIGGGWAYTFSKASGANTITLSVAGGGNTNGIACGEWSGANAVRGVSAATSGSLANPASPTVTTQAGDLLIGLFESDQGVANASFAAGAGFTARTAGTFSSATFLVLEDNLSSPGGAQAASVVATATFITMGVGAFYFIPPATPKTSNFSDDYRYHF